MFCQFGFFPLLIMNYVAVTTLLNDVSNQVLAFHHGKISILEKTVWHFGLVSCHIRTSIFLNMLLNFQKRDLCLCIVQADWRGLNVFFNELEWHWVETHFTRHSAVLEPQTTLFPTHTSSGSGSSTAPATNYRHLKSQCLQCTCPKI